MATTKKPVAVATEKEAKPLKAVAAPKPQLVAVTESAPKVDAPKVAAKAAPAKKAAAKAPAAPKPVAAKPAAKKKAVAKVAREIDPAQRANYIEVAASYIAERRGFAPGNPEQDYLEAAAEIDRMIAADHFAK